MNFAFIKNELVNLMRMALIRNQCRTYRRVHANKISTKIKVRKPKAEKPLLYKNIAIYPLCSCKIRAFWHDFESFCVNVALGTYRTTVFRSH